MTEISWKRQTMVCLKRYNKQKKKLKTLENKYIQLQIEKKELEDQIQELTLLKELR